MVIEVQVNKNSRTIDSYRIYIYIYECVAY